MAYSWKYVWHVVNLYISCTSCKHIFSQLLKVLMSLVNLPCIFQGFVSDSLPEVVLMNATKK